MALQFDTLLRNAMLDAITAAVGANGRLRLYSGPLRGSCASSLRGNVLLVDMPCSTTFAPAASNGMLTVNAITETNAGNTGTATFFRVVDSTGSAHVQGTVGTDGADCNVTTTSIVTGSPAQVTSFTITASGA